MPSYFQPIDISIISDFEEIHKIIKSKKASAIDIIVERSFTRSAIPEAAATEMALNTMIYLIWCFILNHPLNKIEEATKLSAKTIDTFMADIQKAICQHISSNDTLIGGEGITIEIDESKFGKRKTADNLLDIIQRHILPGSIIHTDCFKSYNQLETLGSLQKESGFGRILFFEFWQNLEKYFKHYRFSIYFFFEMGIRNFF
ncbi:hypothetical protein PHYBLDRAFT_72890 [Phycomyces blakesleeanus NRRL 1555(-)]|uniref:ISXO2-like transposase domain-containing protein n=1 Tax=Phycomyces blakesleeanus (strain ATCC 8743b / DSM 1359 / FGSC 10004 / NBRC 33097 / NRRL 1555) TaxID=763407 RepID=A0A167NCY6_PHYB8|nr:hypothetical protein PHYBLDRAFT_72890 [Phycomyces blakesleeanus NRRL 1555(-)]OAD75700.1 hypothetical protein PHYBLDRAFT_72890 [Phycomyces blakesleeanus NRRL 1555(-)]|eukprot:XP_018293740.1 hypothetical protein PHYBLDRAFT_72890 [Phycomyces blakesleeanus NRRL 1555(-)]